MSEYSVSLYVRMYCAFVNQTGGEQERPEGPTRSEFLQWGNKSSRQKTEEYIFTIEEIKGV